MIKEARVRLAREGRADLAGKVRHISLVVRLAPGWLEAAVRTLLLLGAALLIAAVMYSANGPPTRSRKSKFDELAIFNHAFGQGVGELVTETLVLIGLTWWFRDGLRVRLEAKQWATPTRFERPRAIPEPQGRY